MYFGTPFLFNEKFFLQKPLILLGLFNITKKKLKKSLKKLLTFKKVVYICKVIKNENKMKTVINTMDFTSLFEGIEYNNNNNSIATVENQKGNFISRTTKQTVKHAFYSNITYVISGCNLSFDVWINTKNSSKIIYKFDNLIDAVNKVNELRVI